MQLTMETLSASAVTTTTAIIEWCKKQLDQSYELRRLRYSHISHRQESEIYSRMPLTQTPEETRQILIALKYLELNHRAISRLPDAAKMRNIQIAAS